MNYGRNHGMENHGKNNKKNHEKDHRRSHGMGETIGRIAPFLTISDRHRILFPPPPLPFFPQSTLQASPDPLCI